MNVRQTSRVKWLQTLTIALIALPTFAAIIFVWVQHLQMQKKLADLEPRHARLAGLLQSEGQIKALIDKANGQISNLSYPAKQDASQAGNEAQQRIRSLFADSRLDIISIQVLPVPKEEGLIDRIPINLRVEGDITSLQRAMVLLSKQVPLVLVENISLQTVGAVRPASTQRLVGQFSLFVLRVKP